jgi:hypothetical protein
VDTEKWVSESEKTRIEDTIRAWKKNPELIGEWARDVALRSALILEYTINNASGRRAPQDISVAIDRLSRVLQVMAQGGLLNLPTTKTTPELPADLER